MENVIRYNNLPVFMRDAAVRSMRNSVNYSNHVFEELQTLAEGSFYKEVGFDVDGKLAGVSVSFKKHLVDFNDVWNKESVKEVLSLSSFIESFDDSSTQIVFNRMMERAKTRCDTDLSDCVSTINVVFSDFHISCDLDFYKDQLTFDEKEMVKLWLRDTYMLAHSEIKNVLVDEFVKMYSSDKIHEYLAERNPECFLDGRIIQ